MDMNYYRRLFDRFLEGKLTPEKKQELIDWLANEEQDPEVSGFIMEQLRREADSDSDSEAVSPAVIAMLEAKLPAIWGQGEPPSLAVPRKGDPPFEKPAPVRRLPRRTVRRIAWAAAIVLVLGIAALIRFLGGSSHPAPVIAQTTAHTPDIAPGSQGAILTLDNGETMVLDSLHNGVIARQRGTSIALSNGQLQYKTAGAADAAVTYNRLTTPRGRQFRLSLPDGSEVWLNAASSIRYPTVFKGHERVVEISGEAYFEVAKNAAMPFRVKVSDKADIEVLGTQFNVNAYPDEASINTTLLEGSVRVTLPPGPEPGTPELRNSKRLTPGQQAQVAGDGAQQGIKVVSDVNTEKVMAWKNGVFNFQDATLLEVMRQLERWYDIEVVYEKQAPNLVFVGKMGRDLSLGGVLRGLELSGVRFRLEGRKLIVLP